MFIGPNSNSMPFICRSSNIEDSSLGDMSAVSKLEDWFQNVKIKVLPPKEFSLDSCRRRVHSLKLPNETEQQSVEDHHLKVLFSKIKRFECFVFHHL